MLLKSWKKFQIAIFCLEKVGDFATVKNKVSFLGFENVSELIQMLQEEVKVKKSNELKSSIGF